MKINLTYIFPNYWQRLGIGVTLLLLVALCSQRANAEQSWQLQTVDSTGNVGMYSSLVLDENGYPVISYYDGGNLNLVHCGDELCSSGNVIATVDSDGDVGLYTSLVLDSNGHPVISYLDFTNFVLKLAYCGDVNCSSGNVLQIVDNNGLVGFHTSLALDSNGYPVISYTDFSNDQLLLAHCGDATCSSNVSIQLVDDAGDVGQFTTLALDSSGLPVIGYRDVGNTDLKLARCGDADCSSGNSIEIVDSSGDVGNHLDLVLDADDNPVLSYFDNTYGDLRLVYCGDATCSSGNLIRTVDSGGLVGEYTALALDSAGIPVISYFDLSSSSLKLAYCGNRACSSGNIIQTVDNNGDVGWYTALALDSEDKPVISYYDSSNSSLKVARLQDVDTTAPVILPLIDGEAGTNGWYQSAVTLSWSVTDDESPITESDGCTPESITDDTDALTFTCSATSAGGTASVDVSIQIDRVPPETTITAQPDDPSSFNVSFAFEGEDELAGVEGYECSLDDAPFAPCATPQSYNGLANGLHTLQVAAVDSAGNVDSSPADYSWTVQNSVVIEACFAYSVQQVGGGNYIAPGWSGNIIVGTMGNDQLRGTKNADLILGLAGKDVISGLDGDDVICGGAGNDRITGGVGNDQLDGGAENDQINSGTGYHDIVLGGPGNDTLSDPDGLLIVQGGAGIDKLSTIFHKNWLNPTAERRFDGLAAGYDNDRVNLVISGRVALLLDLTGDERDEPASPLEGNDDRLTIKGPVAPGSTVVKFEKQPRVAAAAEWSDEEVDSLAIIQGWLAADEWVSEEQVDAEVGAQQFIFLPLITR